MKILNSNPAIVFANTVRGISSSLLNAFICFAFANLNLPLELKNFIIFFTASNLLLIVLNWGLKDYSVKLFAAEKNPKTIFSKLFSLRITLFTILSSLLLFVPVDLHLLLFIFIFSFLKSFNNTMEAYSLLNNRNFAFAVIDLFCFISLLLLYLLNNYFTTTSVFLVIIASEFLKMLTGIILFQKQISFQLINPLSFLKLTLNYFLVAFFSFLLSKADFYISSLYLLSKQLINYHIYSSLIGLSQVVITAFFSRQMVNWFKSNEERFTVNMKRYTIASLTLSIMALPCFYFITLYFYKFTVSPAMLIMCFFNLFIYSFILLEIYLNTYQNNHRFILVGVLFSSVINIILSFILIRCYGTIGAILANIISLFVLYLYFKFRNVLIKKNVT